MALKGMKPAPNPQ